MWKYYPCKMSILLYLMSQKACLLREQTKDGYFELKRVEVKNMRYFCEERWKSFWKWSCDSLRCPIVAATLLENRKDIYKPHKKDGNHGCQHGKIEAAKCCYATLHPLLYAGISDYENISKHASPHLFPTLLLRPTRKINKETRRYRVTIFKV